jgi:O-antigen/teichoic acid export membrane protein
VDCALSGKLLKAGAIYALANALSSGIPLVLLPVLTRALAPADFGLVVDFFLLATLCTALAGLGVHGAISVKWFDRSGRDFPQLVGNAIIVAAASTAVCALLAAGLSLQLGGWIRLPTALWVGAAVYSGCGVITAVRTSLWQSQEQPLAAAAMQVSGAALNVALSLAGVFLLGWGGTGRVSGALAAALLTAIAAVLLLAPRGQTRWTPSVGDTRELVRFGVALMPHTLAGAMLATIDRLAVSASLGRESLGIYGAAAQLGMMMTVIADACAKTLAPWMYRQMAQRSARARLRIVATAYLSVPIWLCTAVLLWAALRTGGSWLLGERYVPALQLSLWFFMGGAMTASYLSVSALFFFTGKVEWLSTATMTAAATMALLAPLLTRHFGMGGAGASYVVGQSLLLALALLLSTRAQPMPWGRPLLALRVLRRGFARA